MKKIVFTAAVLGCMALSVRVIAQDEKPKSKSTEEIIIRKKGDKNAKITIEVNGDYVTINDKPLSEFKDDDITINKRKVIIRDKNGMKEFDMDINPGDFMNGFNWNGDGKEETYAFLGVTSEDADNGAKISEVTKESGAGKAGLKTGDVITKINDKKVSDQGSLLETVRSFKPKEEVTIYYTRDGKENTTRAILGEKKQANAMSYVFSGPNGMTKGFTIPKTPGIPRNNVAPKIQLWDNNDSENNYEVFGNSFPRHQKLGLKIQDTEDGVGVKVLDVDKDSPAEKAGLKKDDVVTEINGKKVSNTDETREQLQELKDKEKDRSSYTLKAKRNGSEMNFDIKIPKKLKTANL